VQLPNLISGKEIEWQKDAFDRWALRKDYKELVLDVEVLASVRRLQGCWPSSMERKCPAYPSSAISAASIDTVPLLTRSFESLVNEQAL
jgi:hypothetical protein